ncbi:MAG: hypothetical protein M0R68_01140 [Bacteroidetes bacterium]|nr:hypothetical protein [Bacteroidota bacterium]
MKWDKDSGKPCEGKLHARFDEGLRRNSVVTFTALHFPTLQSKQERPSVYSRVAN